MRIRLVVAATALLLPAVADAQRIPLPGVTRRGPGRPADLPPEPGAIARETAYRRWRLSVESYPLLSFVDAAPLAGGKAAPWYTTFGTGTRADYLLTRNLSATLDLTSSYLGGPAITNTAEIGARLHPEWAEHRLYPFVDVRVGYVAAYERGLGAYGDPFNTQIPQNGYTVHYSNGFGVIGGTGLEYALTPRWSLTTAGSVMQSRMVARDFTATQQLANPRFDMTSLRFTVGVRYNPVRTIRQGPNIR